MKTATGEQLPTPKMYETENGIAENHRLERACLDFAAGGPRQLRNQMVGNEIAKSPQKRKLTGRRLESCLIFHALPCGGAQTAKPNLFYPSTFKPVGLL
jgi:hypothetical protein